MINHARTLLLNRDRHGLAGPWEEYVDPNWARRPLTPYLQSVWRILFGDNPDSEMLNWRASQYMQILASTDFGAYVTALDARISYTLPKIIDETEIPLVTVVATHETPAISVIGVPTDDPGNGRMTRSYALELLGDNTVQITDNGSGVVTVVDPDINAQVAIGQSGLAFLMDPAGEVGRRWLVESIALPTRTLVDIMDDLKRVPDSHIDQVFGPGAEPFVSFRKLWRDSRGFAHKLSGLLLAWIYRQEMLVNE